MLRKLPPTTLAVSCLLIGALLVGFAQLAILPPWAGFDDAAHYSYIQQIADKGSRPQFHDRLSAEVDEFFKVAPRGEDSRLNFQEFFFGPRDTIETVRAAIHTSRDQNRAWRSGITLNWEAQQPPLYYLLMAPVYRMSKSWSIADQQFLLRAASYGLAWIGLVLATFFLLEGIGQHRGSGLSLSLAPALWPLIFPMWFPEMARLGNDCLVIFLAACGSFAFRKVIAADAGWQRYAACGLVCGLGLLTKATFIPFVAAIVAVLLFQLWRQRSTADAAKRQLQGLLLFVAVTVAVSGWWYVQQIVQTGNVIGSTDMIYLSRTGGLLSGLSENISFTQIVDGLLYLAVTFFWGTISIPPLVTYLPFLLTIVVLGCGYFRESKTSAPPAAEWVSWLTLAGLLAGLINQMTVFIALWGKAIVPGYYIHSFAPVFSRPVERGIAGVQASPALRCAMAVVVLFPLLFLPLAMFVEGQFFAGCSAQQSTIFFYNILASGPYAANPIQIFENLSVLAFPLRAIGFLAAGWIMLFCGALAAIRCFRVATPN